MAYSQATSKDRPRYSLSGHSIVGDKRTTPIRGDLADIKLAGKLFAPHYAVPMLRGCVVPSTPLFEQADGDSVAQSELLFGEIFAVLDVAGEWAWGYGSHDDYLGYVRFADLGECAAATHHVIASIALVYSAPKLRAPLLQRLPMGAKIACGGPSECGKYLATGDGFVPVAHVAPLGSNVGSPADIAERLMGTPYLWGGRSSDGIDCSGLIQLCFGLNGIQTARDSDMQLNSLGEIIAPDAALMRGDVIFFPDHVGIMADSANLIHANATSMMVSTEPLADAAARFADHPEPILGRRRVVL